MDMEDKMEILNRQCEEKTADTEKLNIFLNAKVSQLSEVLQSIYEFAQAHPKDKTAKFAMNLIDKTN